jgi:membrane protein DedA with SNARE-associated domain
MFSQGMTMFSEGGKLKFRWFMLGAIASQLWLFVAREVDFYVENHWENIRTQGLVSFLVMICILLALVSAYFLGISIWNKIKNPKIVEE